MALDDVLRRLGGRVRDLRAQAGLTQEMLAERAGITWHFVSAIERGTKAPTIETLAAIAAAVDVSLSELFLNVDRALPRQLGRITTAFAGRDQATQAAVLKVIEDALALADVAAGSTHRGVSLRAAGGRHRTTR